ncbi:MAG: AAA family ATPase, partial [Clostridia bacterium]|nr:AAA family ATPase [Clostridia bacterium]
QYENAIWCFDVPQLDSAQHMAALGDFIAEHQLEVLILDPTYLMMLGLGDDAGNLFVVGRFLKSLGELAQRTGCTPLLCHHLRKTRAEPYEPPELEEIAWAGFQEFVRQWVLLGRRKRYDPADGGHHELWMSVGGSAGHSGLWALNIDEGTRQDPGGRRWEVEVLNAHEAYDQRAAIEEEQAERRQARQDDLRQRRQREAVWQALCLFPGGETPRVIRESAGVSGAVATKQLARLVQEGIA